MDDIKLIYSLDSDDDGTSLDENTDEEVELGEEDETAKETKEQDDEELLEE